MLKQELNQTGSLGQGDETDAFLHCIAHEIRQPLAMVVSLAEVIQKHHESMPTETINLLLQKIAHTGQDIDELLNNLLLLSSRQDINKILEPLDMGPIVTAAQQRLSPVFDENQAEIAQPKQWPMVVGYAPWLVEVWVNYLSNALKYGGRPPRIEIGTTAKDNATICFWVRDNGNGLTHLQRQQLFGPYQRMVFNKQPGPELSLSIIQRIVARLGGQVRISSSGIPGQGSTFSFTLPLAM